MTFIYQLDPYFLEIYWMCENELPCQGLRKLSSDRHTGRQTEIIYNNRKLSYRRDSGVSAVIMAFKVNQGY